MRDNRNSAGGGRRDIRTGGSVPGNPSFRKQNNNSGSRSLSHEMRSSGEGRYAYSRKYRDAGAGANAKHDINNAKGARADYGADIRDGFRHTDHVGINGINGINGISRNTGNTGNTGMVGNVDNAGRVGRTGRFVDSGDYIYNRRKKKDSSGRFSASVLSIVLASVLLIVLIVTMAVSLVKCSEDNDDLSSVGRVTLPSELYNGSPDSKAEAEEPETELADSVSYSVTDETLPLKGITSGYGILVDIQSKTVIAEKRAYDRIYPASMTKIMTLIVAVENTEDLEAKFTMTAEITDQMYIEGASVAGFIAGEQISIRDLLYGLILPSGGDAAAGLAQFVGGTESGFVALMNNKVEELGLSDTHFANPTGLHDPANYTTSYEMAQILEYALENEVCREVLSAYKYVTSVTEQHPEGITLTSTVLSRMNGDEAENVFVLGGKTGYTVEAKNCLATFAVDMYEYESEAQCRQKEPRYILVTAYNGEKYGPVFDAIHSYKEYSDQGTLS